MRNFAENMIQCCISVYARSGKWRGGLGDFLICNSLGWRARSHCGMESWLSWRRSIINDKLVCGRRSSSHWVEKIVDPMWDSSPDSSLE